MWVEQVLLPTSRTLQMADLPLTSHGRVSLEEQRGLLVNNPPPATLPAILLPQSSSEPFRQLFVHTNSQLPMGTHQAHLTGSVPGQPQDQASRGNSPVSANQMALGK